MSCRFTYVNLIFLFSVSEEGTAPLSLLSARFLHEQAEEAMVVISGNQVKQREHMQEKEVA